MTITGVVVLVKLRVSNPTFEGLAARPVWVDALVVVLLALIAISVVVAPYAQKENLALLKDNAALKERMGEPSFTNMIEATANPSPSRRIMQSFVMPPMIYIFGLLLQSLMLLVLGRFTSTQGSYVQVLSALVAGFVNALLGMMRQYSAQAEGAVSLAGLDLGADKWTQRQREESERNPFLGLRSIRFCLQNLPLFRTQLRAMGAGAVALASQELKCMG